MKGSVRRILGTLEGPEGSESELPQRRREGGVVISTRANPKVESAPGCGLAEGTER